MKPVADVRLVGSGLSSSCMMRSSPRLLSTKASLTTINSLRTSVASIATRKKLEILSIRLPERRRSPVACDASAASAAVPAPADDSGKDWKATLKLGLLFGVWYAANVYFNIYNKQVLKAFPYPMTCTAIQFGIGSLIACFMWITGIMKRPKIEPGAFRAISPLAGIHVLGNVLTNVSLRAVAPSFTHTVKAAEPLFSVILSSLFLGSQPTIPVVASLLPIVAGVVLASTSEFSFNWTGFLAALGSNITFQSRNVLSKKFMLKGKAGLDNINLFSILTIMSFFILAPLAILVEGIQLTPAAVNAFPPGVLFKGIVAGLTFHAYQQISYMILQRVTPVTHAVGNCVKRIVVIVASVIAFNTPVSGQNAFGTALALAGVFLYSQAKRAGDKKEAKAAAA